MSAALALCLLKVIRHPSTYLPQYTVSTFDQLPIPLSNAFPPQSREKNADIRAVVLDKDNCFSVPKSNVIHPPYSKTFQALIDEYSASNILIVSNSSGFSKADPDDSRAKLLEENTGVKVLRHTHRKPICGHEILSRFKAEGRVSSPSQIVVIGDRLTTDVTMANTMGFRSIWIRTGPVPDNGLFTRFEYSVSNFLLARGFKAPET